MALSGFGVVGPGWGILGALLLLVGLGAFAVGWWANRQEQP